MEKVWYQNTAQATDKSFALAARAHQKCLTKPPGSLGRLESLAEKFCVWQQTLRPKISSIAVRVFAADHGVCDQQVSAFPQTVTPQMIANFVSGGAAISVMSRRLGADFAVVNLGTVHPLLNDSEVVQKVIAPGTADFTLGPAMSVEECEQAIAVGRDIVDSLNADIFIGGEMGIGNSTSASALYCALLNIAPESSVGPGTGVDTAGIARKQLAISIALNRHRAQLGSTFEILRHLGGFEIAALVGAYIRCAQRGIPIVVDGFIASAAALAAQKLHTGLREWLVFSHRSAEPAHQHALKYFDAVPLLDLGLRLGEGSGAALSIPIIQMALHTHNEMATFDGAGVDEGE